MGMNEGPIVTIIIFTARVFHNCVGFIFCKRDNTYIIYIR